MITTMQWTEPLKYSKLRARLNNRLFLESMAFQGFVLAFLATACITLRLYFVYKRIAWDAVFISLTGLSVFITLLLALRNWRSWSFTLERRITLTDRTVTICEGANTDTRNYADLEGFTIFDADKSVPEPGLLVFADKEGHNMAIGITDKATLQDIRSFLAGKLLKKLNEEIRLHRRVG